MPRMLRLPRPTVVRPDPAGWYAVAALVGSGALVAALVAVAARFGWSPSPLTWYLARASGMTLYLLLWFALVTGLGITTKLLDGWGGRGVVYGVHGFATQLAYGLLALHLLSLVADPTVKFGPKELLVPFAAGWREPWTGLGVLAAELGVLVGASFGVRRLIGYGAWRALHWLTFPLYGLALLHGIGAGSDAAAPWVQALYLATLATVVLLVTYRLLRGGARTRAPSPAPAAAFDRLAVVPTRAGRRAAPRSAHAHPAD